jgi:nucleoside-specific outer membrane channel protein Tsx
MKSKRASVVAMLRATALCTVTSLLIASGAHAADVVVKAKKPDDAPFFFVNDNRLTFAYQFTGTSPGNPGTTAKQVYAFTHFDAWAYGTNFILGELLKSDRNDPANPCPILGAGCAGMTEFYGLIRSTFGFNQIFNTKAFSIGPLHNVSFEIGADGQVSNSFVAPAKRTAVAGLQFAFDLPYKGYFNVAPLYYKEWNHNSVLTPAFTAPAPGIADGNVNFRGTWAIETNYYIDLGFLPEYLPLSVSGRAGWYGPKGTGTSLAIPGNIPTKVELNSEPIRLTLDASKIFWGPKYSHFVDVWVAYRYWQNKFGLDHNNSFVCTGVNKGSCTESSLYSGLSVKF